MQCTTKLLVYSEKTSFCCGNYDIRGGHFYLDPVQYFHRKKNTTRQADLERGDDRVSGKEKQNPKEPVVAQATPTLAPLIDNLDIDSKGSLYPEKNFSRRNRIERLLKLIETNPHVQLNYSTKMLQLGQDFSGSPQPSTKVNLVTFLKDLQQTSKTIYTKYKFYLDLLFPFPADKNHVSADELITNKSALEYIQSRHPIS